MKNTNRIKKITSISMLIALFFIFSIFLTVPIGKSIKITFQNLPIFIAAILFNPIIASLVGTLGMFLKQIEYGLTATTLLWIIPYTVAGLFIGILYKKKFFTLNTFPKMLIAFILTNLIITILNTLALYIDSIVFAYYNFAIVFGSLFIKIIYGIIIAIIYAFIVPYIVKLLKKII
jgi:ECF transporter S component (folate family)